MEFFWEMLSLQETMFLLILTGVLIKKLKIIDAAGRKMLSDLLIDVILPCNIVESFLGGMVFPDGFARNNAAEISGHAGTLRNHGVCPKIGNAVGSIGRAAVWLRGVSAPTPKNAFDKAYAVEPVDGRVLTRRRPNHRRSRGLLVVPVICAINGLVSEEKLLGARVEFLDDVDDKPPADAPLL